MGNKVCTMFAVVLICSFFGPLNGVAGPGSGADTANLLINGGFEEGVYSPTEFPDHWIWDPWKHSAVPTWDDTEAHSGERSAKIHASEANDARWIQSVDLLPNQLYYVSGWIKTDNVQHDDGPVVAGANLSLYGTWNHSTGVFGTRDWTRRSLVFNSGDPETENGTVKTTTIGARLGHWGGTATGTAWFDDLQLAPIVPMEPHPNWKILVLIYGETDFEVSDDDDTYHHYVAAMTRQEMDDAAEAARDFVEKDIPALTSGNMVPRVTIRFPDHKLTRLSPIGSGWWPSPEDTSADRDPGFDSVIVIWDTRATDLTTNEYKWIGSADGLTSGMGTGQTYLAMQIAAAIHRGHRNVFKHEWGHSILFFFEAMGTVPQPSVNNHASSTDYVNCITGEYYVWQDETLANPIPNSIYNNESGFTHDYYSGLTATSDEPSRCLGIIPDAWALGGPVTHSGNLEEDDECEYDLDEDDDVDGEDLFRGFVEDDAKLSFEDDDLSDFAEEFGRVDCSEDT